MHILECSAMQQLERNDLGTMQSHAKDLRRPDFQIMGMPSIT
jgi:hypothetical protein